MEKIFPRWMPLQWIFAGYALITGFLALCFSTADDWFTIHIIPRILLTVWLVVWPLFNNKLTKRIWDFINMVFPVAILGSFYYETQFLNQFLFTYRDPLLISIEQWIFGFQPSLAFSQRFPAYWMVEIMSMAYFSYYFITFGFCLYLFLVKSRYLNKLVFVVITSFLLFYSFFIVFPAAGPQFYFTGELTALPEGGFFQWAVRSVQAMGEGPTAAFPSSHVAMTIIILWLAYRHARPVFYVVLPIAVLLSFSTVYIKAHYAVDVLVAFIAAPVVYKGADTLWGFLQLSLEKEKEVADSAIIIREVKTRDDLRDFIHLPAKLHSQHKSWTPPLYIDEWSIFDPKKNAAFEHCTAVRFLAFKNDEPIGRIIGIIHHDYNKKNGENNARFSFMEIPNDYAVFTTLIREVEQWAKANGCTGLIGPFGFSDKDPQGFVIEGFDQQSVMFTNGSFEYMPPMMERYGFEQFRRLVQYKVPINDETLGQLVPFSQRALRSGNLKVVEFEKTKDIRPYVGQVFELINETYASIYGFSEVTKKEAEEFANRFLPLLNPRLIKMIFDENDRMAAFIVAMPNLADGLKKSGGKLLPFGWYHLLKANKTSKELVLLLGAIRFDERNRGIDAVLGATLMQTALELGFNQIDSHLILEDNHKMRRELERLKGHSLYRRYCFYSKSI